MTSQVAVMSLYGAAVASDTVVSLTRGGNTKVIPNQSKIVELGRDHRVLVLNSGNTDLNDFPHDLHLHEWAKTLPGPLSTLTEYVRSYKAWSASERRLSTIDSQHSLLVTLINSELEDLGDDIERARAAKSRLVDAELSTRDLDKLDRETLKLASYWPEKLDDFADLSRARLTEQLVSAGLDLTKRAASYFSEMAPRISPSNLKLIAEIVGVLIGRDYARETDSELGFIGMGSEQSFVGAIKLRCAGVFGGGLQSRETSWDVQPSKITGRIAWFAQSDGIEATINGIHPEMLKAARQVVEDILENEKSLEFTEALYFGQLFEDRVRAESQSRFINPMFSTMSAYSISELSAFAESLVASQANTNIFIDRQSTVGGLIEVASIDPRNGVVWHRRLPTSRLRSSTADDGQG